MTGQSHFQRISGRLYWIIDAVLREYETAPAAFYDLHCWVKKIPHFLLNKVTYQSRCDK